MQDQQDRNPLSIGMLTRLCLVALVLALLAAPARLAAAESAEKAQLEGWRSELDQVEATLQRPGLNDNALVGLRDRVEPVRDAARVMAVELGPRIQAIQLKLGITPASEGDKEEKTEAKAEPAHASTEPDSEPTLLTDLESLLRQAQVTAARADDVLARITERRRQRLLSTILARSPSLLDPGLWYEATRSLPVLGARLSLLATDWWSIFRTRGVGPAAGALAIALALAAAFLGPGRRLLLRFRQRDASAAEPSLREKAVAALWVTLVNTIVPTVSLGLVLFTLQTFRLVPGRIESGLPGIVFAVGFASLAVGLARGILIPGKPSWRLIALSEEAADRLTLLVMLVAVAAAGAVIGNVLLDLLFAPQETLAAWRGSGAIAIAILVMLVLRTLAGRLVRDEEADGAGLPFPWSLIVPASWLASTAAVAAAAFGFAMLGAFIVGQILWTTAILGLLFLLLIVTEAVLGATLRGGTPVGLAFSRSMGLSGARIEQVGVVLSGGIRLMLIVVAALLALAPYGIESGDIFGWLDTIFTGLTIGKITLSFSAILAALALFLVGVIATRGAQRWLDTQFLPRTRMDAGIRNSVKTGVGYAGVILAAMIAGSALGLNISNIAIVAGALSIGIGFGLQSIVNNFVSGLILLAERPIKTGDWIVVGAEQGLVKRISVRATEIETFDRASVIIPNSDLISGVVKNWVHADRTGRITIQIGASYESEPEQIRDLLLDCARSHPGVLIYPEPRVFFTGFGENSLDFQLFCFVGDVGASLAVKCDLHFEILRRLRGAGIEIPFRQNDVTIRNADEIGAALKALAAEPPASRGKMHPANGSVLVDA